MVPSEKAQSCEMLKHAVVSYRARIDWSHLVVIVLAVMASSLAASLTP